MNLPVSASVPVCYITDQWDRLCEYTGVCFCACVCCITDPGDILCGLPVFAYRCTEARVIIVYNSTGVQSESLCVLYH